MLDEVEFENILKKYSFPRLSGSEGELNSFKQLKKEILELGLIPSIQNFNFSTFYSRVYPKLAFFLIFCLISVFYFKLEGFVVLVVLILVLISMDILIVVTRAPEKITFGKVLPSQNLYVKTNNSEQLVNLVNSNRINDFTNKVGMFNILFFSHVDSKSQKLTISTRIINVKIWIFSLVCCVILILLRDLFFIEIELIISLFGLAFLMLLAFSTVLTIINITHNKSNGAIDNASGMACVLNLLKYFSRTSNFSENINLWFVFTGAEECGTMGVRNFFNLIKDFDRKNTLIINFDAIGESVCAFHKSLSQQSSLNRFFLNSIYSYNRNHKIITVSKKRTIGAHSDGYFLKKKGYFGVGFGDLITYKFVHSNQDIIENVNAKLLKDLCELLIYSTEEIFRVYGNVV